MRIASICLTGLLLIGHAGAGADPAFDPAARVRPLGQYAGSLLREGLDKSPTLRRLVRDVERSDVIVYVQVRPDMRHGLGGSMVFLAASSTDRFVRISVNANHNRHVQVALLAHELQHAVEVANAREIICADTFRAFYRRIGVRTGPDSFDSRAAQDTGYLVRQELADFGAGDPRMARHDGAAADEDAVLAGGSIGESAFTGAANESARQHR